MKRTGTFWKKSGRGAPPSKELIQRSMNAIWKRLEEESIAEPAPAWSGLAHWLNQDATPIRVPLVLRDAPRLRLTLKPKRKRGKT